MSVLFKTPLFASPLLDTPLFGAEGGAVGTGLATVGLMEDRPKQNRQQRQRVVLHVVDDPEEISLLAQTLFESYYL